MKVVILCGGQGTRIRDASESLPKPMLPIGGQPILWHIMKIFEAHGLDEFVLCLGHKSWVIKEFFLNYRAMTADLSIALGESGPPVFHDAGQRERWRVTLAETGEHTGTAGRVARVRRYLEADGTFCLTYGDAVGDIDLRALQSFHATHGKVATVTAVRPPGRFGEMRLLGERVSEFNEKPQVTEGFINGGFFVFDSRRIWDYLPEDPASALEATPMQRLCRDGQLMAFAHTGFWQPMDTYREYVLLNDLWAAGRAPWARWLTR